MDRIPLQLSLDFESDDDTPSVRVAPEKQSTKATVVCLKQFRNERSEGADATDTTLLYKSILDSIRHFA